MGRYFSNYSNENPENQDPIQKPHDTGGEVLPFGQLDWRTFEILVYRLKTKEADVIKGEVTLMKGSQDQGRDILIYNSARRLSHIVQCKRVQDGVSEADVYEELIKLGLHNHLEPEVCADGPIKYELYCSSTFAEKAAALLDGWPRGWTWDHIKDHVERVIKKYAAFKSISLEQAEAALMGKFKQIISTKKYTGMDVSDQIRKRLDLLSRYFEAHYVVKAEDLPQLLPGLFAPASSADLANIAHRIQAFRDHERLVLTSGYVFGVKPELIVSLQPAETLEFLKCIVNVATRAMLILQPAIIRQGERIIQSKESEFSSLSQNNHILRWFIKRLVTFDIMARVAKTVIPAGLKGVDNMARYEVMSFEDRVEWHLTEECIKLVEQKNPSISSEGSNSPAEVWYMSKALLVARSWIAAFGSADEFHRAMREALLANKIPILQCMNETGKLVPKQIMTISDSNTVFDDEHLRQPFIDSMERLEKLRTEKTDK